MSYWRKLVFLAVSIVLTILIVTFVVSLVSCGKRQFTSPKSSQSQDMRVRLFIDYDRALVDLDALPVPAGVDAGRFSEMKALLKKALLERKAGKAASSPPGEGDAVTDLAAYDSSQGQIGMQFHYRNFADYNQDGVVYVSDITPLAMYLGDPVPIGDDAGNSIQDVLDGSGNDVVDYADVPFIAANMGNCVTGYSFRGSNDSEDDFDDDTEVFTMSLDDLRSQCPGQAFVMRQMLKWNRYSFPPGVDTHYRYWKVIPYDDSNPKQYGPLSTDPPLDMQITILGVGRRNPEGSNQVMSNYTIDNIMCGIGEEGVLFRAATSGPGGNSAVNNDLSGRLDYGSFFLSHTWDFTALGDVATRHGMTQYLNMPETEDTYECSVEVDNRYTTDEFVFNVMVTDLSYVSSVSPLSGPPEGEVQFTAVLIPEETEPDSWLWDFGDMGTADDEEIASPTVTLTDEIGTYSGSVTITVDTWQYTLPFQFKIGYPPDYSAVEFADWEDNHDLNGVLEGDMGAAAKLTLIPTPSSEPPSEPVEYTWDIPAGAVQVVGSATDTMDVILDTPGTYNCSVTATNFMDTWEDDFTLVIHRDEIKMRTEPANAVLSGDDPVTVVVSVVDTGHDWSNQFITVMYDDDIVVDLPDSSWNWGTTSPPTFMLPGGTDGIWSALGITNNINLFNGTMILGITGPASPAGWIKIDGVVPLNKCAFKRHSVARGGSAVLGPAVTNDVMCFTVRLSPGGQQSPPQSVTLEFVDVYYDLFLNGFTTGTLYNGYPNTIKERHQYHVPLVIPVGQ